MNKCIFCGALAKEPTRGLKAKSGNPMSVILIRMMNRDYKGNWENYLIEVFAFNAYAAYIEKRCHKGMKIIAICKIITKRWELQPRVGQTKNKIYYKPFFILEQFFCTETPEAPDYAEDRQEVIFAGALGEAMVEAANYQQQNKVDANEAEHGGLEQ